VAQGVGLTPCTLRTLSVRLGVVLPLSGACIFVAIFRARLWHNLRLREFGRVWALAQKLLTSHPRQSASYFDFSHIHQEQA